MTTRKSTPKPTSKNADLKKLAAKSDPEAAIDAAADAAYGERVAELEAEGLTTSDAQAAADAEAMTAGSTIATDAGVVIAESRHVDATPGPVNKGPLEPTIKVTKVARAIIVDGGRGSVKSHGAAWARIRAAFLGLPENGGPLNLSRADADTLASYVADLKPDPGTIEEEAAGLLVIRIGQALAGERQTSVGEYLVAHPRQPATTAPKAAKGGKPRASNPAAGKAATSRQSGKTVKVAVEGGGEVEVSAELAAAMAEAE